MANKLERIQKKAEILGEFYADLERKERDAHSEYKCVGYTDEQARDWRTGELLWEDEEKTIPKYREKYDYVTIPDDELSESAKLIISVIQELKSAFEKMV